MNTCTVHNSFGSMHRSGMWGSQVWSPLVGITQGFSKVVVLFYIPNSSIWSFSYSIFLPKLGINSVFNFNHSGRYNIVSHCGLNLMAYEVEHVLYAFWPFGCSCSFVLSSPFLPPPSLSSFPFLSLFIYFTHCPIGLPAVFLIFKKILFYFKFWDTCTERAGLLHR